MLKDDYSILIFKQFYFIIIVRISYILFLPVTLALKTIDTKQTSFILPFLDLNINNFYEKPICFR